MVAGACINRYLVTYILALSELLINAYNDFLITGAWPYIILALIYLDCSPLEANRIMRNFISIPVLLMTFLLCLMTSTMSSDPRLTPASAKATLLQALGSDYGGHNPEDDMTITKPATSQKKLPGKEWQYGSVNGAWGLYVCDEASI